MTLWTFAEVAQNRPGAGEAGAALAALHAALRDDPPVDLPWLAPATEQVTDALSRIEERSLLPADRTRALRRRHAEVLDGLTGSDAPGAVLHGDAHGGNLLRVGGRWCWTDLEETCRGPVAWDLAVLAGHAEGAGEHGGRLALAGYAAASGAPVVAPEDLAPSAAARRLEAAVWLVVMAEVHPRRYATLAPPAVAAALEER